MLGASALGRPRGMVWGGRREEGSEWGTHVYLKHNNPKPMGHVKAVLRGKFIAIQAYLKKQEKVK